MQTLHNCLMLCYNNNIRLYKTGFIYIIIKKTNHWRHLVARFDIATSRLIMEIKLVYWRHLVEHSGITHFYVGYAYSVLYAFT